MKHKLPFLLKNIFKKFNYFKIDWILLLLILITTILGFTVFYSVVEGDQAMVIKRVVQICVGIVILIIVSTIPTYHYKNLAILSYITCFILLVAVYFFGESSKGSQRWLNLGFVRFQPSEIAKLVVPLCVSMYFSRMQLPIKYKEAIIASVIIFIPTSLVLLQPDLGTSLLIICSGAIIIFMAGVSWRFILVIFSFLLALLPIFWNFFMHDYQKRRILGLLKHNTDPLGDGYHVIQSKIAIGSGGIWGKGLEGGTQGRYEFLPESHTDFIFAILGEELGLIGVIILFTLYILILARIAIMANKCTDNFSRLLIIGLGFIFFIYIFVNVGMVSGILPVVGVPLPLISYGGTSYVIIMTSFAMIMSLYKNSTNNIKNKKGTKKSQ